ncbi:hypothetical protein L2E82_34157, partial [Cichorium intybus]
AYCHVTPKSTVTISRSPTVGPGAVYKSSLRHLPSFFSFSIFYQLDSDWGKSWREKGFSWRCLGRRRRTSGLL